MSSMEMNRHKCEADYNYRVYGRAIITCYEHSDGRFFVSNYEYASEVDYCPMCGEKSKTPAKRKGENDGE